MFTLAADPSSLSLPDAIMFLAVVLAVALAVALGLMYLKRQDARTLSKSREQHEAAARLHHERESNAFNQHTELNAVAAQKMKREVELLDIQLQLAKFDMGMRHDSRDYHDLMMEKARLEIESLKQHIKEQRKRNEDFGEH